jgi:hypothetical protein
MSEPSRQDPATASKPARSLNEIRYCLMVTPCPACGRGPLELEPLESPLPAGGGRVRIRSACAHCLHKCTQEFFCVEGAGEVPGEQINPTDEPSRLVDLGQWLGLFHLLLESAVAGESRASVRREGFRAALCLAEALKFYPAEDDSELPEESAFFSEASLKAFREHPGNFARQRLRDMLDKLPSLHRMQQRVQRDDKAVRRRWWRFWRR